LAGIVLLLQANIDITEARREKLADGLNYTALVIIFVITFLNVIISGMSSYS
jgi:hypothetical protein